MELNTLVFNKEDGNKIMEAINNATIDDLFAVTASTIGKMVKTFGDKMHIRQEFRGSNHWDSTIDAVEFGSNGKLFIDV